MGLSEKVQMKIPGWNIIYTIIKGRECNKDCEHIQDIANQMMTAGEEGDKERVLELYNEVIDIAKKYDAENTIKSLIEDSEKYRQSYLDETNH